MSTKEKHQLSALTPKSQTYDINGLEVRVAADKGENMVMNMLMASHMRAVFQATIKKYQEQDSFMSPKELKDLTEAAANIAKFSGEVYAASDDGLNALKSKEKAVSEASADDISFDVLAQT